MVTVLVREYFMDILPVIDELYIGTFPIFLIIETEVSVNETVYEPSFKSCCTP